MSVKMLSQLPPPHPALISFSPGLFLELQEILYQLSFALIRLFQKIMHFEIKKKFSSNLLLVSFDFAILCLCVSWAPFNGSTIMKLQIASYLYI